MQCVSDSQAQEELLMAALTTTDVGQLLMFLHASTNPLELLEGIQVFHEVIRALQEPRVSLQAAVQCVYALSLHGANINQQDEEGNIALLCYLRECSCVEDSLLHAFLRCGSDPTIKNQEGEDVLGYILKGIHLPKHVKARILDYMPGIWRAVDSDDAMTVRRLINQWCNIRVSKHGMSVTDLAFSKGTENIIRVITGIGIAMDLGHAVLAGDVQSVQKLLEGNRKLNVNLKNMGDGGATPLFYAMCNHDWAMVDLLLKHGARIDIGMQGDKDTELPLYFAALSASPGIEPELLLHTIPTTPVSVDQLLYKGRNVIFYCIEHTIDIQLFEAILQRCSACVLTQQIKTNQDARSYALHEDKVEYVAIIDKVVRGWLTDEVDTRNRNLLALHGYIMPRAITPADCDESLEEAIVDFLTLLPEYEEHKTRLVEALDDGNLICVKELLYSESWSKKGMMAYFAESRPVGSAQPLLHKAVLRQDLDLVRELGECLVYKCHRKLDSIRDQYLRTALHYAYALENGKQMINTLEDLGMSEHAMDKDGRSPLVFRDRKSLPEMNALLQYHLLQDLSYPEPDPWSVTLPLPIMGYIAKCAHAHHSRRADDSAQLHSNQYQTLPSNQNGQLPSNRYDQVSSHQLEYRQYDRSQRQSGQDDGSVNGVENQWDELTGRFSQLNHDNVHPHSGNSHDTYQTNSSPISVGFPFQGHNHKGQTLVQDYDQLRDNNVNVNDDTRSWQYYHQMTDSNDIIAARTQALHHMLYEDKESSDETDENGSKGDDDSESLSDVSNNDEDYEGDYSDLESDGENDLSRETGYCTVL